MRKENPILGAPHKPAHNFQRSMNSVETCHQNLEFSNSSLTQVTTSSFQQEEEKRRETSVSF